MRLSRSLLVIYMAGFLRSLGVGLLGVDLAVYLSRVGVSATGIGLVIGAGLLGACVATAAVAWGSVRLGYRASLVTLSLLAALGGWALAILPSFPIRLFLAFVGMVNGMGTDRSAAFALEQAIIPALVLSGAMVYVGSPSGQVPSGCGYGANGIVHSGASAGTSDSPIKDLVRSCA